MTPRAPVPPDDALRQAAEARLAQANAAPAVADPQALLRELQVHQVELQLQNEELRRAQVALDVARARWFDLYEMAPCGYATLTLDGTVQQVNQTLATLLDVPRDGVVRRPFSQFVARDDHAAWYRLLDQLRAGGGTGALDAGMVRRGGAEWTAQLSVTLGVNDEHLEEIRLVVTDTTARTTAEAEAQRRRAMMETIIDAIPSHVFSVDRTHRLTMVNTAMAADYATTKADLLGRTTEDLFLPDIARAVRAEDERMMVDATSVSREMAVVRRRDGAHRVALVSKSAVQDARGVVTGLVGVATDVTALRDAEVQRIRLSEQVQQLQRMESIGRLAGGVAHDFNNQLGVILGNAEMALLRMDPSRPEYEGLVEIRDAALRSSHLTRQLLTFARRHPVQPAVLNVNETVARVLGMLRRLIGEQIELVWRPGAQVCPIRMDAAEIEQILTNLALNARDAIGGAGVITVTSDVVTLDNAWCAAHQEVEPGEYACLTVADTGCGMSPEVLANVFEPFFTTKGVGEGTGLGLASVYGAVRQGGGTVTVQSEVGVGSTFALYFPRAEQVAGRARGGAGPALLPTGHETILLLEDEEPVRRLTVRLLERYGYTVLAAESPEQAIAIMGAHGDKILLLLTDVVMPGMDGPTLASILRENRPHLRVLMMSGYAANVADGTMVALDGIAFIAKPFSMAGLLTKVREVLDRPEDPA